MFKLRKFFICFMLSLILISSCVFATDDVLLISETPVTTQENAVSDTLQTSNELNQDLYIYDTEYCSIGDIIYGNVFASTLKLVINPRNNGGIISGDLFAIASELNIESDVVYSNNKDKNGNFLIDHINSKSIIDGNVYAFCDNFTLQAGSEIRGDLYVAAKNVTIEQDALIDGNIYVTAENVTFNGQLSGSAYVSTNNFTTNYSSYITRDLYLNTENATLDGVIFRDAFITANNTLTVQPDFILYRNLIVDFADNVIFSGEIQGDAIVNSKNLNFKNMENDVSILCTIRGNLDYATKNETTIPDGVVLGKVSISDYVDRTPGKFNLTSAIVNLFTLLVYVFVIVLLAKRFAPKCIENMPTLTFGNILSSLGAGFASLFAVFVIFVFLCLSGIGIALSFALLVAYLFVLAISLPLFVLKIANTLKFKIHEILKVLIVTFAFYIVFLIPVLGSIVMALVMLISIGRVLLQLLKKQ